MKIWTKPEYELIDMNAEIGSYQEDFGGERDPVAVTGGLNAAGGELEPTESTAARTDQAGVTAGGALA